MRWTPDITVWDGALGGALRCVLGQDTKLSQCLSSSSSGWLSRYLSPPDVRVAKNSQDTSLKKLPHEAKIISNIKISSHPFLLLCFQEYLGQILRKSAIIHKILAHKGS